MMLKCRSLYPPWEFTVVVIVTVYVYMTFNHTEMTDILPQFYAHVSKATRGKDGGAEGGESRPEDHLQQPSIHPSRTAIPAGAGAMRPASWGTLYTRPMDCLTAYPRARGCGALMPEQLSSNAASTQRQSDS